jgi:replicative DNA helicase
MAAFPEISLERGMPASPDAERSILGAILLENAHFHEAAEKKLIADDFSLDSHRRIFARMEDLIGAGRAVDLVTLVEELARRKEVASVRGLAYIDSLL